MAGKPSFLRDPDQAAELAALLQDHAQELETEHQTKSAQLGRVARTQVEQAIARYRRWAGELVTEPEDAPAEARPLHIRPAREEHGEATG